MNLWGYLARRSRRYGVAATPGRLLRPATQRHLRSGRPYAKSTPTGITKARTITVAWPYPAPSAVFSCCSKNAQLEKGRWASMSIDHLHNSLFRTRAAMSTPVSPSGFGTKRLIFRYPKPTLTWPFPQNSQRAKAASGPMGATPPNPLQTHVGSGSELGTPYVCRSPALPAYGVHVLHASSSPNHRLQDVGSVATLPPGSRLLLLVMQPLRVFRNGSAVLSIHNALPFRVLRFSEPDNLRVAVQAIGIHGLKHLV